VTKLHRRVHGLFGCSGRATHRALPSLFDAILANRLRPIVAAVKSLKQVLQVSSQILLVVFKRDVIDSRCLASFQSAERMPDQLIVDQREEVVENRFWLRFRSLVDVIQPG